MLTVLEAINIILSAIGSSPVSTPESQHPDVLSAKLVLKLACLEVQASPKWFNTEPKVTLNPNNAGEIILPSNCLNCDPVKPTEDYVQRGTRLYNKTDHTFVFTVPVEVDLVLALDFSEMPFVAQSLCTYNAAHAMQANFIGDERKLQNLSTRYAHALTAFKTAEIANGDYNIMNSAGVNKLMGGIKRAGA